MDLLRLLGEMGSMDAGDQQDRRGLTLRSTAAPAKPSQCFRLAVWQRRSTTSQHRDFVFTDFEGHELAQPFGLVSVRHAHQGNGRLGSEDVWSVRLRSTKLLAHR